MIKVNGEPSAVHRLKNAKKTRHIYHQKVPELLLVHGTDIFVDSGGD